MGRRLTLEELTDRFEIDELLNRYVAALDDNRFDQLSSVFTSDAHISYADAGMEGDYETVSKWLAAQRPTQRVWLHLVGNRRVDLDGDAASVVSTYFFVGVSPEGMTFFTGGEYHDRAVRTADGWRIAERIEKQLWALAPTGGELPTPAS
jgi:3-phenylpropionate/cinnamic acid dioxygenase small subunit